MGNYCTNCGKELGADQNVCTDCNRAPTMEFTQENNARPEMHDKTAVLNTAHGRLIVKYGIIGLVFGVLAAASGANGAIAFVFVAPIYINMLCWGWRALDKITPNIFLILPIIGWLIYFGIKFVLAMLVGWVAFPKAIYEAFREARE